MGQIVLDVRMIGAPEVGVWSFSGKDMMIQV